MTTDPVEGPDTVQPAPDPGNAPPEDWTEPMDPAEVEAVMSRLQQETGGV